ncbi:hypothetical protein YC2023_119191 [Brassica napus]
MGVADTICTESKMLDKGACGRWQMFETFIRDPIRKSGYPEKLNPDPDRSKFGSGYPPDIIIFRRISDTGYPRTPDPDKDSKLMDPPDKDPDLDILKFFGYPICLRPW